jgi:hypothetical protein
MSEFDGLLTELKHIKALLAMDRVKDFESNKEKILYLDRFGFDGQVIADLIGTTPGTVAVAKSQAKKKSSKRTTKKSE